MDKVRFGVIGVNGRGAGLMAMIMKFPDVEVTALCDNEQPKLDRCKQWHYEFAGYEAFCTTDYNEILTRDDVDAVLIATAWEPHIPIAIAAMRQGKAVAMEVGGAYSLYDCHELVRAYEETKTPFMLMENCCFNDTELWVTSMVRNGVFGEIVHCAGSYTHDLRHEVTNQTFYGQYRRRNYSMRNCENYPTHELGPIAKLLGINRGNRMVSLVSVGSKSRGLQDYIERFKNDPNQVDPGTLGMTFNQSDIVKTLITCANGETIEICLDTSLPSFGGRNFTVHGTRACSKWRQIAWDGLDGVHDIEEELYKDYLPECWQNITQEQIDSGHGGMDGFEFREFVDCLKAGKEMPIDVYDAASWMCISCLTEASIAQGGMPQAIPDFTHGEWLRRPLKDVIELPKVGLPQVKNA